MSQTVQTLLIVFVVAPAAAAALVVAIRVARARRLRHLDRWMRSGGRESESEPASPVPATPPPGPVRLPVLPVPHVGATESWSPLAEIGTQDIAPELISDLEADLAWAQAWHQFEHDLRAELDRICAPALVLAEVDSFDELREVIGLREALDNPQALHAWLAGQPGTAR